jgi:hypothetical protein
MICLLQNIWCIRRDDACEELVIQVASMVLFDPGKARKARWKCVDEVYSFEAYGRGKDKTFIYLLGCVEFKSKIYSILL